MKTARTITVLFASLLIVSCFGCQQAASDVEAKNKTAVRQVFAALDAEDYDQLRLLLSEDFALHYVGEPEPFSRDATFELMRVFFAAFPDYVHNIEEIVAEGDKVVIKLTAQATHRGVFEGIPPTGKRISYAGVAMVTFVDGVATEWWTLEDNLGLMMQLGMQLSPAEAGD